MKQTVNLVSDVDPIIWENQMSLELEQKYEYIFTTIPVKADFCIVFGKVGSYRFQTPQNRTMFILTEPPEIQKYPVRYLKKFGLVAGPEFPYLKGLSNHFVTHPYIPWHIGIDYSAKSPLRISLSELKSIDTVRSSRLTVITSGKRITKLQKTRLDFIDYLKFKMPEELEIFGRDYRYINDKSQVLSNSKYHLALENSLHRGYWTEKLSDSIFMGNVVFYSGAPDIKEFFPGQSVIELDLNDFESAYRVIRRGIDRDTYGFATEDIILARQKLLDLLSFSNLLQELNNDRIAGLKLFPQSWSLSQPPFNRNELKTNIKKIIRHS